MVLALDRVLLSCQLQALERLLCCPGLLPWWLAMPAHLPQLLLAAGWHP